MWSELYIYRSACKALVILVKCNDTWILSTDFRKILKFHVNACCGSRFGPMGRTDGHYESNSSFLHFPFAPKMCRIVFNTMWITRGVKCPLSSSLSLTSYSLGLNYQHCITQYLLNPSPCLLYVSTVHCKKVPRKLPPPPKGKGKVES